MRLFGPPEPCDRCRTAEERASEAVRKVNALALDFEQLQDYVQRQSARVARRTERASAEERASEVPGSGNNLGVPGESSAVTRILARRHAARMRAENGVPT